MASLETDFTFSLGGLPPMSARGCTQTLVPIANGELRRTVNGQLVYTGTQTHEKYRSIIECEDKAPAAFDNLWPGAEIKVGCISRLWQKFQGQTVILSRDPVAHSIIALTPARQAIQIASCENRQVDFAQTIEEGYVSYCPLLNMRVVDLMSAVDEWGLKVRWRLVLEES